MTLFFKPLEKSGCSRLLVFVAGISFLVLTGCASKGNDFYKHQPTLQPLDVPPDLTLPEAK